MTNEDELYIDYNDQFFQAYQAGFELGVQHGAGVDDDSLWLAFLEYLEAGDGQ